MSVLGRPVLGAVSPKPLLLAETGEPASGRGARRQADGPKRS